MHAPHRFLCQDWSRSQEGREIMLSLIHRTNQKRKVFGLLERPSLPSQISPDEYQYKVFVSGKSGVGKTSTIAKLSGNTIPAQHNETPGLQTTSVYWPAKMLDIGKVVMFNLQFWDAGENALKKFDHIMPVTDSYFYQTNTVLYLVKSENSPNNSGRQACKSEADAVIFLFSFVDKSSFNDIPQHMSRILEPGDNVCKMVAGTKVDLHAHSEITHRDIRDFESNWKLPVKFVKNTPQSHHNDPKADFNEIVPLMNYICEQLWIRDQVLAGKLEPTGEGFVI